MFSFLKSLCTLEKLTLLGNLLLSYKFSKYQMNIFIKQKACDSFQCI